MKKIRLAIVGTGSIAFTHMYGIQRLDEAELVAIMDIHTEQMDIFRKTFPMKDEDCYTDLDALLAREDVDAVIVCASDKAHCDIAVRAMRAGKDVLCEKPMALDLNECREMIRVSEETGRRLMIGQVCRKAPDPDGRQGFCTVAVCDAIVRSAATGEKIAIDYTI